MIVARCAEKQKRSKRLRAEGSQGARGILAQQNGSFGLARSQVLIWFERQRYSKGC
jgi:hypothetical protein